jgi:hypothetical protein
MGDFFMRDQESVRPTFTTIYHDKRIELGLNFTEYVLLDTVFILSQNSRGYCYKSIKALARDLGMSFDGIRTAILRLAKRGLLIHYQTGYKTSDTFIQAVYLTTDRKSVSTDRKSVATDRKNASQQMLDIQENNNRKAHGTPRENPRVHKPETPLSEAAKRLQQRLDDIRRHNPEQNNKAA